jgi:NTP pyrophosphatase (non-canonical NTP hydrolase)
MDIQELTQHMDEFVRSKGWYTAGSRRPQTARNLAVSLNLEAAEVLEHFQWTEQPANPAELAGELADVALYLLQLAQVSGIDLEQAVLQKLAVNRDRTWDADKR